MVHRRACRSSVCRAKDRLLEAFEGEHGGIADAKPRIPENQHEREQFIIGATLQLNLPASLHSTFHLGRLEWQLLSVADIGWSADESRRIHADPVVLAGESEECLDSFEFLQRGAWAEFPCIAELTERLSVKLPQVQKASLAANSSR